MALLSIILPVYNVASFLRQSLDSVFLQPESKDCEVILINDGSTDNSLQIAIEYAEKYENIHVIDKGNEGVSATRNQGIEASHGDYLFFMDSDDILHPKALRIIFESLTKHNPDILTWQYATFYTRPKYARGFSQKDLIPLNQNPQEAFNKLMTLGFAVSPCTKAFRRGLFDDKIRFDSNMSYGEDMFFCWKSILLAKKIMYIPFPLYYYRQSGCSAVSRYHDALYEKYRIAFDEIYDFATERNMMTEDVSKDIDYHFAYCLSSLTLMEAKAPYSLQEKEAHLLTIIHDTRIERALRNDSRLSAPIYTLARKGEVHKMLANAKRIQLKSRLLFPLKKLLK